MISIVGKACRLPPSIQGTVPFTWGGGSGGWDSSASWAVFQHPETPWGAVGTCCLLVHCRHPGGWRGGLLESARVVLEGPTYPCREPGSCLDLEVLPPTTLRGIPGCRRKSSLGSAATQHRGGQGSCPPPATGHCAHTLPLHPRQTGSQSGGPNLQ